MNYPNFFNDIETIKLKDELSEYLGAFEKGIIEFSYLDIVKSSGHSCPTIAGAYIMTLKALKELYKDEMPKRGEIFVSFRENSKEGVTGVIANVVTQITGATESLGFKGLNGKFERFGLMKFNEDITLSIKFQRLDTKKSVEIIYNPDLIPLNPKINQLHQKIRQNRALEEEKIEFGKLWQERVNTIFKNIDKVVTII
ncbi:FmdE family protein [Halarcobacter anaerophilus]|uniref:FmdE family protein n=1 Tax=Halarcobacter anaerophilus TaxID=877500 RepID=UPI0005CAAACB|nr:FmdE family protein [Halarcobacter anaerophilus]